MTDQDNYPLVLALAMEEAQGAESGPRKSRGKTSPKKGAFSGFVPPAGFTPMAGFRGYMSGDADVFDERTGTYGPNKAGY